MGPHARRSSRGLNGRGARPPHASPRRAPLRRAPRRPFAQSLDGEYLASGQAGVPGERSGNAPVIVWAFREAALVFKLDGLRGKVEAVAISRCARSPAAAHRRAPFARARRPPACPPALPPARRDNRFVAGSDEEGRLLLWDLQSGQVANASKHERPISSVAFGPVLQRESRRGASRPSTYRLAACAGSVLKELTLDFNGRSMQFELSALAMVMPANGLHRAYPTLAYAAGDQFLLAGRARAAGNSQPPQPSTAAAAAAARAPAEARPPSAPSRAGRGVRRHERRRALRLHRRDRGARAGGGRVARAQARHLPRVRARLLRRGRRTGPGA